MQNGSYFERMHIVLSQIVPDWRRMYGAENEKWYAR